MGFHVDGLGYLRDGRLTVYNEHSGLPMDYVARSLVQPYAAVWTVAAGRLMLLKDSRFSGYGTPRGLPRRSRPVHLLRPRRQSLGRRR